LKCKNTVFITIIKTCEPKLLPEHTIKTSCDRTGVFILINKKIPTETYPHYGIKNTDRKVWFAAAKVSIFASYQFKKLIL